MADVHLQLDADAVPLAQMRLADPQPDGPLDLVLRLAPPPLWHPQVEQADRQVPFEMAASHGAHVTRLGEACLDAVHVAAAHDKDVNGLLPWGGRQLPVRQQLCNILLVQLPPLVELRQMRLVGRAAAEGGGVEEEQGVGIPS
jgi:hypothetical protein